MSQHLEAATDALHGSIDLLILKALSLQPMHGWGLGFTSNRARYYALTNNGREARDDEVRKWKCFATTMSFILES